jgi:hypothetical protein
MNYSIEINSLVVNKLKSSHDNFIKYDIDVALDEIENNESGIKLKYKIVLLSNPTNTKITIEGFTSLFGNESEISKQLEPDKKNIPVIVNIIYQDIFPFIYILSKGVQIPCPSYRLTEISPISKEATPDEVAKNHGPAEQISDSDQAQEKAKEIELSQESVNEPIIQEVNVSSI